MLLQFCKINKLIVANTRFEKPLQQQVTYRKVGTPEGQGVENGGYEQIDYILTNARFKNSILDANSDGKARIRSDHFLVKCWFACRSKKQEGKETTYPTRYSNKQIGKLRPEEMKSFIRQNINEDNAESYEAWTQCYRAYVEQQPKKQPSCNNGISQKAPWN